VSEGSDRAISVVALSEAKSPDIPDLVNGGPNRVPLRFAEAKKLEKKAPGAG